MSSTPTKPSWTASRLPFLAPWRATFTTPAFAREAPYLATLPVLIGAALLLMAATGLVLAVYYNPWAGFASLQFIARDVNNGWLVRGMHQTGTTMILGAAYLLLFRGMLGRHYKAPGELVWLLGVAQFCLLLLVAWLGYVLTDGACAYWSLAQASGAAATLTGAPGALGTWFFGGAAGAGALARMAVFHAVLALAALGLILLYLAAARAAPQTGPKPVAFHPYYTAQYFVAFVVFALIFCVFLFFLPHFGMNRLNAAAANKLLVPVVAVPPWYLLPVSDVARVAPGIWGGILLVAARLGVLFALPWLDRSGPRGRPGGMYRFLVFVLAADVLALGLCTASQGPLTHLLAMLFTLWYFLHFLVLTPLLTAMEAE